MNRRADFRRARNNSRIIDIALRQALPLDSNIALINVEAVKSAVLELQIGGS